MLTICRLCTTHVCFFAVVETQQRYVVLRHGETGQAGVFHYSVNQLISSQKRNKFNCCLTQKKLHSRYRITAPGLRLPSLPQITAPWPMLMGIFCYSFHCAYEEMDGQTECTCVVSYALYIHNTVAVLVRKRFLQSRY